MQDDIELIELEISRQLDRLGLELQAAATRLRFAPYVEIQSFIESAQNSLQMIGVAGWQAVNGNAAASIYVLNANELPEIEFDTSDADSDVEAASDDETVKAKVN